MIKQNYIPALAFMIFCSLGLTDCSSTKGNKNEGDDEIAAKLLMNNPAVSKFQQVKGEWSESNAIQITLEKIVFMSGWKSKLDLNYKEKSKKWNAEYVVNIHPVRGSQEKIKTQRFENLQPKSSWMDIIQTMNQHHVHSIRDAEDIDYQQVLADGENFIMTIRIGDQERSYAMSNPGFYANEYADITDFVDFAAIIELLDREFIEGLENTTD